VNAMFIVPSADQNRLMVVSTLFGLEVEAELLVAPAGCEAAAVRKASKREVGRTGIMISL
jgi:hypothetical protein